MKMLGVRITEGLHTSLKTHAAKTNQTMQELITTALERVVAQRVEQKGTTNLPGPSPQPFSPFSKEAQAKRKK